MPEGTLLYKVWPRVRWGQVLPCHLVKTTTCRLHHVSQRAKIMYLILFEPCCDSTKTYSRCRTLYKLQNNVRQYRNKYGPQTIWNCLKCVKYSWYSMFKTTGHQSRIVVPTSSWWFPCWKARSRFADPDPGWALPMLRGSGTIRLVMPLFGLQMVEPCEFVSNWHCRGWESLSEFPHELKWL